MFLKTLLKIYIYTSPFNITHSVTTLSVSNYRSVFIRLQQDFTIACCEFNFADMRLLCVTTSTTSSMNTTFWYDRIPDRSSQNLCRVRYRG